MTKPAFSQILLTLVAALVLTCIPLPASAQNHGGARTVAAVPMEVVPAEAAVLAVAAASIAVGMPAAEADIP